MSRIVAVTPGDPDGIGPEIVWKTLRSAGPLGASVLCVGAREPFDRIGARVIEADPLNLRGSRQEFARQKSPAIWLLAAPSNLRDVNRARARHLQGFQSGWSIEQATRLVLRGEASALVTGPISKERLQAGGYHFPGHTEFLAHLCGKSAVTMMLANDLLRVSLVTTHLALKDASRAITRGRIRQTVLHTVLGLGKYWGIKRPRIAVAALNPHAGEGGLFGNEERMTIAPEIRALQSFLRAKASLLGPLPADTLFARHVLAKRSERFDAVICMYHDQGLIPVKLLDFPNTVNVTLGLPIVRTSVDHGVGFDLVGTGKADPSSFQAALRLASRISRTA